MSGCNHALKSVAERKCLGTVTMALGLEEFNRIAQERGQPFIGLWNAPFSGITMELIETGDGKLYLSLNGFGS